MDSACTDFRARVEILTQGTPARPHASPAGSFHHSSSEADSVETKELDNPRLIGPVYLGLYGDIRYDLDIMPLPDPGIRGGAYPYGGTSLGDFQFSCLESMNCRLLSGRYVDFDALADWFNEVLETPILDAAGKPITSGEVFRSICYDLLNVSLDEDTRLIATQDKNDDGAIDEGDLQFVKNADGDYEASFTFYQQDFFEGFKLWGFLDSPAGLSYRFESCNTANDLGYNPNVYNINFDAGAPWIDVLNRPGDYMLDGGDWVSSVGYEWTDPEDEPVLVLDFEVGADDVEAARAAAEGGNP